MMTLDLRFQSEGNYRLNYFIFIFLSLFVYRSKVLVALSHIKIGCYLYLEISLSN